MIWKRRNSVKKCAQSGLLFFACSIFVNAQSLPNQFAKQKSVEQLIESAAGALQAGDFDKTGDFLKKVFQIEPKNVAAHTLAGIAADRKNDLASAEKHFSAAARLQPGKPETRNNYGAILFRLNRTAEAAREFEASLAANPDQPSAQINLAQIYFAKGAKTDLITARSLFEKSLSAAPDPEIARAVVVISLRLEESERAASDYKKYFTLAKNAALPSAEKIELSAALVHGNLIAEAVNELESLIDAEPNNVEAVILLSRAFLKQKNIKSAGRALELALASGINDARIYAALTDVYEAGGYYENAIPAMKIAVERNSRNEQYRYRYGMLLIASKAPAAAVIRLREAINEFPRSAVIWLGLGIAQYHDGKLNDAEQSLNRALEIDSRLVLAFSYLAFMKTTAGQTAEANSYFERALAVDEKNAVLHYLLADNLQKTAASDDGKIERHLRRAIELDPALGGAYLALGRIYVRQKKFTEAAAMLEKTVAVEPTRNEAYYQLAQVYSRLKRTEEAKITLAKFKELSEREKNQTKSEYSDLLRRLANVNF